MNLLGPLNPAALKTQAFSPLNGEVVELSLLVPVAQVAALEAAAQLRGLTLGQIIRRLIQEFTSRRD